MLWNRKKLILRYVLRPALLRWILLACKLCLMLRRVVFVVVDCTFDRTQSSRQGGLLGDGTRTRIGRGGISLRSLRYPSCSSLCGTSFCIVSFNSTSAISEPPSLLAYSRGRMTASLGSTEWSGAKVQLASATSKGNSSDTSDVRRQVTFLRLRIPLTVRKGPCIVS